jgi:hypothetical protein
VAKYLETERRAGNLIYQASALNWEQDLFSKSKFGGYEKRIYEIKVTRNIDQELGNLYSMSWARRWFFGRKIRQFETEYKRDLSAISSTGMFTNRIVFDAYFLLK